MIQVIIPMAGEGKRFADAGYELPKPLIDVCGRRMIDRVMDSLTPADGAEFLLLCREPSLHRTDRAWVYQLPGPTQGAVDTLLHAEAYVDFPIVVANCDQWIAPGVMDAFLNAVKDDEAAVMTFSSTNPHHSYVRRNMVGIVTEVVEKQVISDDAILGVYYFADSQALFDYARKVIANNLRTGNGEFYVSSILDLFVKDGGQLTTFEVDYHDKAMLGTPEELRIFEQKVAQGRIVL